jgi:ABC-type thiamine transport system substrate-binding protein
VAAAFLVFMASEEVQDAVRAHGFPPARSLVRPR